MQVPKRSGSSGPAGRLPTRLRLAQALAFVGLIAALIGALGPAHEVRTVYSWPPAELPSGAPSRQWYTPLLLIRRQAEVISASVPCTLPPPLPKAAGPLTVLATARFAEGNGGLSMTGTGGLLVIKIGEDILGRVPLSRGAVGAQGCTYRFTLGNGLWSIDGGLTDQKQGGALPDTPLVTGFFSSLDLRSGARPAINATTVAHASRASARQAIAWTLASVGLLGALLLVAVERKPKHLRRRAGIVARAAVAHAHPADGIVGAVLIGWWLIAPAVPDDGWVLTRLQTFSSSSGFSAYYNAFGANQPLGYWLEWAQHWLAEVSSALLILRIPSLVCLTATWLLCRWIMARLADDSSGRNLSAVWTLASAFIVLSFAWGMTVRPEPVVALLVTGVLACTVRFVDKPTPAPLAVAVSLVALAIAAHPAGIVSLAPLLVVAPKLARWGRAQPAVVTILTTSFVASVVVMAFVGSDIRLRSADAGTFRTFGDASSTWRDELTRYALMSTSVYQTPPRRAAVALMILAVLAYLVWRRRSELLNLPGASLAVSLVLLIPTPSKWPIHFGALLGITALAVASETTRLRLAANGSTDLRVRPFLVIAGASIAAAWSWWPRAPWNDLDLGTLDWTLGFETSQLSLANLAALVPFAVLLLLTVLTIARGHRLHRVPWRVASWTTPIVVIPALVFTAGLLIADTVKADGSTRFGRISKPFAVIRSAGARTRPLQRCPGRCDHSRWPARASTHRWRYGSRRHRFET